MGVPVVRVGCTLYNDKEEGGTGADGLYSGVHVSIRVHITAANFGKLVSWRT